MCKFETDGFLGQEAVDGKKVIQKTHVEFFTYAKELNSYCMKQLNSRKIDWEDNHKLVISVLFLRSVEIFQSVFLMLEIGIMPSAKILTRTMLEIVFTLVALQKNPELLEKYSNQHEQSYFYNLKSTLEFKNEHLRKAAKEHGLEKIYIEKKRERKNKEIETLSPKQWAVAAELEDLYNVYYNIYSDSIHCNPSALDDHVDNKPEEINLAFGPADRDLFDILKCCIYLLINAANSSALALDQDISGELDKFMIKISFFDEKYI